MHAADRSLQQELWVPPPATEGTNTATMHVQEVEPNEVEGIIRAQGTQAGTWPDTLLFVYKNNCKHCSRVKTVVCWTLVRAESPC
jgi:hypothetical protein